MASNLKYSLAEKNDRLASVVTRVGPGGVLTVYSGVQPASPDVAISGQVPLSTHALSATLGTVASGVLTFNAIADGTGTAGATAAGTTGTFARITTSAAVAVVDMTVGTTGCDLNMTPDSVIKTAQPVSITALTITAGN